MSSPPDAKRDLLIAWMKQCFDAAGLEASEKEAHSYAAITATEIIDEGLVPFAEGNSIPHGAGSNTVAGGSPVPRVSRLSPISARGCACEARCL